MLYAYYQGQYLRWGCKTLVFENLQQLLPLIAVRIVFCFFLLSILRMSRLIETKVCIHVIIDKIYVAIVFSLCNMVTALDLIRIWFLLNIFRMNRPNDSKSCKHIINDKTYVGNLKRHFSQICNSDTVLDGRQNLLFAQYLEMKRRNETKFCIHIIIDKTYVGIVKRHFSQICGRVGSLTDVRIWFLLNILRTN